MLTVLGSICSHLFRRRSRPQEEAWIRSGGSWFMSVRTEQVHGELTLSRLVPHGPSILWLKRWVVPLRSSSSSAVQSLTGVFSDCGADEVAVNFSLERNQFVLSRGEDGRRLRLKVRQMAALVWLPPTSGLKQVSAVNHHGSAPFCHQYPIKIKLLEAGFRGVLRLRVTLWPRLHLDSAWSASRMWWSQRLMMSSFIASVPNCCDLLFQVCDADANVRG